MKSSFFKTRIGVTLFLSLIVSSALNAEVKLPKILGDNMVLQRNEVVRIWGWADAREKVSVTFNGQQETTRTGKDGKWMIELEPMKPGGPFQMVIKGKNEIIMQNILIGDVWVCGGQSNMEWTLANTNNAKEEIIAANYPEIRLFDVPHNIQVAPAEDIPSGEWTECAPETVARFSAVGYFFGKNIHEELGVPVGLISSNWGGTNVETWTSKEMSQNDPEMKEGAESLAEFSPDEYAKQIEKERKEIIASLGALEKGIVDGDTLWSDPGLDDSKWKTMEVPGLWEEQGLKGIDGVVWFRKEFNLTDEQAMQSAVLNLGKVDDSDITWINGRKVGEILDEYDAERSYPVPASYLKSGTNSVVVRVEDYRGGGGIYGDEKDIFLKTEVGNIPLAGTWKYRPSAADFSISLSLNISPNSKPTLLYNGMINPIINYSVLGAIWYQGESNAGRAYKYRSRFKNLIKDWRNKWENPDMGFYFVQLANYMEVKDLPGESNWAELREAQTMALSLPYTGMAVIIDIGEADDIHPRNKKDVGKRLAVAALHGTYGKDIVYSGPVLKDMTIEGGKVILEFDPMGSELVVKDKYGYVMGFAIAGEDREFHWARGVRKGNKIYLLSDHVPEPVAVRYAWANNPDDANVYNSEGLPAGPFRTDDWRGVTWEE